MESRATSTPVLKTLLLTDLVESTRVVERLGDARAAHLFRLHDRLARDILSVRGGVEIDKSDGFLLLFDRPIDAVRFALEYNDALTQLSSEMEVPLAARVGIHLGEVLVRENRPEDVTRGAKPVEVEGLAKAVAARIMSLAVGNQVLLTQTAFEVARRAARGEGETAGRLRWLAHGPYQVAGVEEPLQVFEVGIDTTSPLCPPPDTAKARRVLSDGTIPGWRAAVGLGVPLRPNWVLHAKLAEGGFGEVWLASHRKTRDRRVFKFCLQGSNLRSLQREITVHRLLRESLGERPDIARILDWNLDEAPFFIECEYAEGGDLARWAESQGGLDQVPLDVRLDLVAQVADTVAAAHSVGVLHKDIKPGNIFIALDDTGAPVTRLADFGVGTVTEVERLDQLGITRLGMSEDDPSETGSAGGTYLYMPPERLEGNPPTSRGDVYSLGVMLYQMVVGDLSRILAPGWHRDVDDEILQQDIADCVDRSPDRRPGDASDLARRLRSLDRRHAERDEQRRRVEEAELTRRALERSRRRRLLVVAAAAVALVFALTMAAFAHRTTLEARRANREAEAARQVSDFLVGLFQHADPSRSKGQDVTAREMLEQGSDSIRTELHDQPIIQARLTHTIGHVYLELGQIQKALDHFQQELDIRTEHDPSASREMAENLKLLAISLMFDGRYDEAEPLFRRALDMFRTVLGDDHEDTATCMRDLGRVLHYQDRLDEAEPLYERALAIHRARLGRVHRDVGRSLFNLAAIRRETGRLDRAEADLREACEVFRAVGGDADSSLCVAMSGLAGVLREQGRHAEAIPLFNAALELQRTIYGERHYHVSTTLADLALTLLESGDTDGARTRLEQAIDIERAEVGDDHPNVLRNMRRLARVHLAANQPETAEGLYRQILERQRGAGDDDAREMTPTLLALGELLLDQGRPAEAEPVLQRAHDLNLAHAADDPGRVASTAAALSACLAALGRHDEAERVAQQVSSRLAAANEGGPAAADDSAG
jgi:serine/threonine-protein kinase